MPERISLHHRVKETVIAEIVSGSLSGRLPNMSRFGQEFAASRITMRNVLKELETEGYVVVRHGSGTFVSYSPEVQQNIIQEEESNPFLAAISRYTQFLNDRELARETKMRMVEVVDKQIGLVESIRNINR